MDKPSVIPGLADRMWPTEKAITKAIADAGEALSDAVRQSLTFADLAAGDEAVHLARTRRALAGARRRRATQEA